MVRWFESSCEHERNERNMNATATELLSLLNMLIASELRAHTDESHRPRLTADASDYLLQVTSGRVKQLRRIREELENILTASTCEDP
jgi:hypothetical protein